MHPLACIMQDAKLRKLVERHAACDAKHLPERCPDCGKGYSIDEREHEVYVCVACSDVREGEVVNE